MDAARLVLGRAFALLMIVIVTAIVFLPSPTDSHTMGIQKIALFKNNTFKSLSSRYLIFLPPGFGERKKMWPLIVFLHGGSARGRDINRLKRYVLPGYLERGFYPLEDFPFIVISPQYSRGKTWRDNAEAVHLLIDEVCRELPVDRQRIYLTGPSIGGEGTWFIASRFPGRFAAIAPVAAVRMVPEWASAVKGTPIWAFAGRKDRYVPFKSVMKAVRKIKGEERFRMTIYNQGHVKTIHSAYQNRELYAWFLKQRNGKDNQVIAVSGAAKNQS